MILLFSGFEVSRASTPLESLRVGAEALRDGAAMSEVLQGIARTQDIGDTTPCPAR